MLQNLAFLRDMLNGEGGAASAVIARVRYAWKKFCELSGMPTRKNYVFEAKRKVTCVRSN